jgi:hypothetical protein
LKNYEKNVSSLIVLSLLCSSCATSPVTTPERINAQGSTGEESQGLLEDAAKVRSFNIYPDAVSTSIDRLYKNGSGKKETYREIQKLFCNGNQSKLNAEFHVKVMTPQKAPSGTPINQITKAQKEFLYYARLYLKNRFLLTSGEKPVTRLKRLRGGVMAYEDHDFNQDYLRYILKDDKEYGAELRGQQYTIPFMKSQSKKDVESFYSSLQYMPMFLEKRWIENPNNPDFHIDQFFFSIISSSRSALIVAKASPYLAVGYDDQYWHSFFGNQPAPRFGVAAIAESSDTLEVLPTSPLETYYNHGQVMVSDVGWQMKAHEPIYPLQVAYARDLNFLIEHFTFILNREILEKEFHISDPSAQQALGVDFNTGKFVPSEGIDRKGFIWNQVLRRSTLLKEAPAGGGATEFTVTLDTSLFCRYGSPVTDLQN